MSAIPLIFTSGWASGINSYAVVLLLGLLGRFGSEPVVPPALERTDVLIAAAVLYLGQFVFGKIPYVDSVWDVVHTVIRPIMGAAVGALIAGHAHSLPEALAASIGGSVALVTHLVKTGIRVGVNTSPEPVSNIIASSLEDLVVAGIVVLGLLHPLTAAIIAGVLLLLGIVLVIALAKRIRSYIRNRRERRERRRREAGRLTPTP
jgi:hypothetical protein